MIDLFQWYVWPADSELHEAFPYGPAGANSPQARRLQCLFAEARAAGVSTRALFAIVIDWARVLDRTAPDDPWNAKLCESIAAADAALYRANNPLPKSLMLPLLAIDSLETDPIRETPTFRVAKLLATQILGLAAQPRELAPESAWEVALVVLAAIASTVEAQTREVVMIECAQRAYASLFPQCQARARREHD